MPKLVTQIGAQMPLRVAMVASRDIEEGEQLLFDYCFFFEKDAQGPGHKACNCKHALCRKWLY
jgi:SET domain-containing protein